MYAAAGGASLASRQARKKQAAQNNKNKASNQQILREKLAAKAATTPTKSKQFHQLPASYLKAPHQHHRKLSAGYTTVPGYDHHQKSLLPISEQSSSSGHGHHHHHPHHPASGHTPGQALGAHPTYKPTGFREYDKLVRRQQLTRSATATLPLASHALDGSPPQTPTFFCPEHHHHHHHHQHLQQQPQPSQQQQFSQPLHLQIPNDPIIITPATPQATPPGKLSLQLQHTTADADGGLGRPLTPSPGMLERKCSVYRSRKLGEQCDERCFANYTTINNHQAHQHPDDVYFGPGFPNGTDGQQQQQQQQGYVCKWDTEYYCCDAEHRQLGVCTCDHSEDWQPGLLHLKRDIAFQSGS